MGLPSLPNFSSLFEANQTSTMPDGTILSQLDPKSSFLSDISDFGDFGDLGNFDHLGSNFKNVDLFSSFTTQSSQISSKSSSFLPSEVAFSVVTILIMLLTTARSIYILWHFQKVSLTSRYLTLLAFAICSLQLIRCIDMHGYRHVFSFALCNLFTDNITVLLSIGAGISLSRFLATSASSFYRLGLLNPQLDRRRIWIQRILFGQHILLILIINIIGGLVIKINQQYLRSVAFWAFSLSFLTIIFCLYFASTTLVETTKRYITLLLHPPSAGVAISSKNAPGSAHFNPGAQNTAQYLNYIMNYNNNNVLSSTQVYPNNANINGFDQNGPQVSLLIDTAVVLNPDGTLSNNIFSSTTSSATAIQNPQNLHTFSTTGVSVTTNNSNSTLNNSPMAQIPMTSLPGQYFQQQELLTIAPNGYLQLENSSNKKMNSENDSQMQQSLHQQQQHSFHGTPPHSYTRPSTPGNGEGSQPHTPTNVSYVPPQYPDLFALTQQEKDNRSNNGQNGQGDQNNGQNGHNYQNNGQNGQNGPNYQNQPQATLLMSSQVIGLDIGDGNIMQVALDTGGDFLNTSSLSPLAQNNNTNNNNNNNNNQNNNNQNNNNKNNIIINQHNFQNNNNNNNNNNINNNQQQNNATRPGSVPKEYTGIAGQYQRKQQQLHQSQQQSSSSQQQQQPTQQQQQQSPHRLSVGNNNNNNNNNYDSNPRPVNHDQTVLETTRILSQNPLYSDNETLFHRETPFQPIPSQKHTLPPTTHQVQKYPTVNNNHNNHNNGANNHNNTHNINIPPIPPSLAPSSCPGSRPGSYGTQTGSLIPHSMAPQLMYPHSANQGTIMSLNYSHGQENNNNNNFQNNNNNNNFQNNNNNNNQQRGHSGLLMTSPSLVGHGTQLFNSSSSRAIGNTNNNNTNTSSSMSPSSATTTTNSPSSSLYHHHRHKVATIDTLWANNNELELASRLPADLVQYYTKWRSSIREILLISMTSSILLLIAIVTLSFFAIKASSSTEKIHPSGHWFADDFLSWVQLISVVVMLYISISKAAVIDPFAKNDTVFVDYLDQQQQHTPSFSISTPSTSSTISQSLSPQHHLGHQQQYQMYNYQPLTS